MRSRVAHACPALGFSNSIAACACASTQVEIFSASDAIVWRANTHANVYDYAAQIYCWVAISVALAPMGDAIDAITLMAMKRANKPLTNCFSCPPTMVISFRSRSGLCEVAICEIEEGSPPIQCAIRHSKVFHLSSTPACTTTRCVI